VSIVVSNYQSVKLHPKQTALPYVSNSIDWPPISSSQPRMPKRLFLIMKHVLRFKLIYTLIGNN